MEFALLKIESVLTSLSGRTKEVTYRFLSETKWKYLTAIPPKQDCNAGITVFNNDLYVFGGYSGQGKILPIGFKYSPR